MPSEIVEDKDYVIVAREKWDALTTELETLRAENAILLRQRAPEYRSELESVTLADTSGEIARTAKKNMDDVLKAMGLD
jgi:hypothetical protein